MLVNSLIDGSTGIGGQYHIIRVRPQRGAVEDAIHPDVLHPFLVELVRSLDHLRLNAR